MILGRKALWLCVSLALGTTAFHVETIGTGPGHIFLPGPANLDWHAFQIWHDIIALDLTLGRKSTPAVIEAAHGEAGPPNGYPFNGPQDASL